jgi:hypothetical protein
LPSKYELSAHYEVIKYLWQELKTEGLMLANDYKTTEFPAGIMPIVPVQDQPQLANAVGTKPYIVYDFYRYPAGGDNYWTKREELTFNIYCPDINKIYAIGNLITEKFHRMDLSAAALNKFVGPTSTFIFHCSEIQDFQTYLATRSEGGRDIGEITVCYDYTRDLDKNGLFV